MYFCFEFMFLKSNLTATTFIYNFRILLQFEACIKNSS